MKFCDLKCPTLPVVRKCCFCVPIRRGVTLFGYVNLVLSLLSFPLLIFLLVEQVTTVKPVEEQDEHRSIVHLTIAMASAVIDVIMTILLLIGAHRKKTFLLKLYFHAGIILQLLTLGLDLAQFDYREYIENILYFFFLSLNIYLLFLVYSVIHIIEECNEVQYVAYEEGHQLSI